MGAAGVWLTFWLGRRVGGAGAGLMAATLLACSPIFLFQLAQPMSDVPTTVWWLAAMVLATDPTPRSSVGAGSIVSLALLTRPNLMPLAVVVGAYLWWNKWSDRRASSVPEPGRLLTWFASAAAVGVIVIAAWHAHLYGSPVRSGYGAASELFSLSFARPNIQRYTVWMFQTHTPLVALAVLAPFAARLTPSGDGLARQPDVDGNLVERFSWCALGFSGAVFVAYLIYASFDDWTFLRFLLPAFPLVFVLVGLTIGRLAQWLAAPSRTPVLFAVTAVIAVVYLSIASDRGVFRFREHERRYRAVGEFLAARLPADAMIVTVQHSGSAFYYSGRPILRWDAIEGGQLEETLAWVRQHGYRPFVVLERWEVQPFRERFASASPLGGLDWPPMAQHRAGVLVYDPEQRSRFTTGAIVTEDIDNLSDGVWSRLWP
jgi:4-amino-4-deoxy-L-arabinose transferase-like glycosyltransferase